MKLIGVGVLGVALGGLAMYVALWVYLGVKWPRP